jgi:hypothetical protein
MQANKRHTATLTFEISSKACWNAIESLLHLFWHSDVGLALEAKSDCASYTRHSFYFTLCTYVCITGQGCSMLTL